MGAGRDERAFVRAAQRGSASGIEALFRLHWPRAHRAAYLVVHDAAAAEDIAQEAFLAAVRNLDRFDRSRPFGPWLHRIVVNRAIDWARARTLRAEVELPDSHAASPKAPAPLDERWSPRSPSRCLNSAPSSSSHLLHTHRARSPSCSGCRAAPSTRASAAGSTCSREIV